MATNPKIILRQLHADLVNVLDPDVASAELFTKGLLTDGEKEKVDAGTRRSLKNNDLLDCLRRRDATKALHALIEILEGKEGFDKEANSTILQLIEKKYPKYSYENGLTDNPPPPVQQPTVTPLQPVVVPTPIQPIPTPIPYTVADAPTQHVTIPTLPDLVGRGSDKDSASSKSLKLDQINTFIPHDEGTDGGRQDRYPMNSIPRGYCVIINNVKFTTLKNRAGSDWDADALQKLFGKFLGFHVERYDDLDSHRMLHLMQNIQEQDHSRLSCLVVAILSHGINGEVYGADGKLLKVEKLTNYFSGRWCPTLVGKPKIFILQACRGGSFDYGAIESTDSDDPKIQEEAIKQQELKILDEDETDGGGYTLLPDNADFVLAYATTPGFVSWRNSAFGTWFVKSFVDTMYEKASTDHLMDNLTEVNRMVAEEYESRGKQKQMPAPVTTLRYKLYLTPVAKTK